MKKTIITLVAAFLALTGFAQPGVKEGKALKKLSEQYNKGEYKALFEMLSDEFKAATSEKDITDFYANNIRKSYGKIIAWQDLGMGNFKVKMEHGMLDLALVANDEGKIGGMNWAPAEEVKPAKKTTPKIIKSNNKKTTKLERIIDSLATAHLQNPVNCGLAIGIIKAGKTTTYFYGATKKTGGLLPGDNTLFEIGSITKTFTGTILAHAINEGRMNLEDDITKYLPAGYDNLSFKGKGIKIKHLANHTSRLPAVPENMQNQKDFDKNNPYKNYSTEMLLDYLKTVTLDTFPGAINEYSNMSLALLGVILEGVYNKGYDELVSDIILKPLNMKSTVFKTPTPTAKSPLKMASGYNGETGVTTPVWDFQAFASAGGLKSTIGDMLKYLKANMDETNADMKLAHQTTYKDATNEVAINWIIKTNRDKHTLIWHNGRTYGFSSFCGYVKEKGNGVVVLNNSGVNIDVLAVQLLGAMAKE